MSGLGSTDFWVENGIAYLFDEERGKELSVSRVEVQAGELGVVVNRYLKIEGVPTINDQGFLIPRPATITGVWVKSRNTTAWKVEIRKNGIETVLEEVNAASGQGQKLDCNLDMGPGDWLQLFANGVAIHSPIVVVELAWRLP